MTTPNRSGIKVGIDVGGPARGFHAVAFDATGYLGKLHSSDPKAVASWCKGHAAKAVGVDAPCCWSGTGRARRAERELMAEGISCFSTPSLRAAKSHPANYFGWMLNGARLYTELLSVGYELFTGNLKPKRPVCFETFPQAIACALAGELVSAKRKRQVRRAILQRNAIETGQLTNIDWVDAALCALAADRLLAGSVRIFGDREDGLIVVPCRERAAWRR